MDLLANILIGVMVASHAAGVRGRSASWWRKNPGVLNLGVEGMMIIGAIAGFATVIGHRQPCCWRCWRPIAGGALMALLFAIATQTLLANQVASGLALTHVRPRPRPRCAGKATPASRRRLVPAPLHPGADATCRSSASSCSART